MSQRGYYIFAGNGQSVTLILDGKPFVVASDKQQYQPLVDAIKSDDWDAVSQIVNAATSYGPILQAFGDVAVYGGHIIYKGRELHNYLVGKILEASQTGLPVEPLGRFLENALQNPDPRAANDLYGWCEASGLPLTNDGCIIAYKRVGADYLDIYSKTIDHTPGRVVEQPREQCDPDPNRTCSRGLHFCSASYLRHYSGARVVLVKINPRDVVAFPTDYGWSKGRACRYEVLEEIPAETVDTHFDGIQGYYALKPKVGDWVSNGRDNFPIVDIIDGRFKFPGIDYLFYPDGFEIVEPPISVGDWICLKDNGQQWASLRHGLTYYVSRIEGNDVILGHDFPYPMTAFDVVCPPDRVCLTKYKAFGPLTPNGIYAVEDYDDEVITFNGHEYPAELFVSVPDSFDANALIKLATVEAIFGIEPTGSLNDRLEEVARFLD
jgi:hypothetical protein